MWLVSVSSLNNFPLLSQSSIWACRETISCFISKTATSDSTSRLGRKMMCILLTEIITFWAPLSWVWRVVVSPQCIGRDPQCVGEWPPRCSRRPPDSPSYLPPPWRCGALTEENSLLYVETPAGCLVTPLSTVNRELWDGTLQTEPRLSILLIM